MPDHPRERRDDGRFSATVTDEELVAAVRERQPVGTSTVADAVGLRRQSADYRLRQLAERGIVKRQTIGGSLAWSVADEEPDDQADSTTEGTDQ